MNEIKSIVDRIERAYKTAEGREVVGCALPILLSSGERSYCIYLESNPYNICREKVVQAFDEELLLDRGEILSGLKQVAVKRLEDLYSDLKKKGKSTKTELKEGAMATTVFGGSCLLAGFIFPPVWIGSLVCFGLPAAAMGALTGYDFKDKRRIEGAMKKLNKLMGDWEKEVFFVPEMSEELKSLADVVYKGKGVSGCPSPIVYRGIKQLTGSYHKDVDPKCISKYRNLVGFLEAVGTYSDSEKTEGTIIYPSIPELSIGSLGIDVDFVEMYKTDPEHFKALFTKIGREEQKSILKKLVLSKERNEKIDEWLSETYPTMSKNAAMEVVKNGGKA